MKIVEVQERSPQWLASLLEIWETAVRATHHFLSEEAIQKIRLYVPQALMEVPHLLVAEDERGTPMAFMGVDGQKLEMLFVAADARGRGYGSGLLRFGIERYAVNMVDVNEQNPQARAFYEKMGFRVVGRSPVDGQGDPYPLLHMRRGE